LGLSHYIAKRAVFSVVVVFVVAILSFTIIRLAPGDPATLLAGEAASPDYVQAIRAEYGLDQPLPVQLVTYLSDLARGNLGYSLTFSRPVINVILERLPQTILLVGTALCFAIVVGVLMGITSAKNPNSLEDGILTAVTLTLYSIPVFWLGLVMIMGLALWIPIFPTGGLFDVGVQLNPPQFILNVGWHLVLPALTLSAFFLATYARLTRAGLLEAMGMNYVVQARAKGVRQRDVLYHHALKNALLPIITVAGIQIGLIVGGVVLTESVYSWPGIGSLLIMAVSYRDYPLVTGIFLITAISVAISNLAADIIIGLVDPRIRTGAG